MAQRLPNTRCARRRHHGGGRLLAIALLCALGFAPSAAAVTISSSWLSAANGDWDDATQWSPNSNFPNNGAPLGTDTYDVTIDATGSPYTVTLDTNITIDNLTLDSSDATVSHTAGTLAVTGSSDLTSGAYAVDGGTLQGGTWNVSGGSLSFANTAAMDNATVNVDGSGARFGVAGDGALTLGSNLTVNLNVTSARVTSDVGTAGNGTVINQGTIDADGGGGSLFVDIDPDVFVNQGTVTVRDGATLDLGNDWDNDGQIDLDNGKLRLQGSFATADIGTITRTGTTVVQLQGSLDNSGDTLTLDATTGSYLLNGGTIQNGTVEQLDGETLTIAGSSANRLDGTAVNGGLDLSGFNSQLRLANGASFAGTATLGSNAKLGVEGVAATLDQANILLSGSSARFGVAGDGTLTLGSNLTVNLTGSNTALGSDVIQAGVGTLVNQGSVSADGALSATINPDTFTNQGLVEAIGGATLTVGCASCSVTNVSGGTLSGGSWKVVGASNLELFGDPVITTNQADVTLSGASSVFDSVDSLTLNDTTGSLHLLDNRDFNVTGAFTNRGTLELGGGTFTATSFSNEAGGAVTGSGMVSAAVSSAGTLAPGASAGRIDIAGDLTLLTGSELDLQLGGSTQGTEYDFIDVIGTATLAGALSLSFLDGFENDVFGTDVFTLLDSDTDIVAAFANVASGGRLNVSGGLGSFEILYGVGSGFAAQVVATNYLVPEPSTGLLLAAGLTALAAGRRRRSRLSSGS